MPNSTNISSLWTVEFSAFYVTAHAWGSRVVDEFAASDTRLFVIGHENGAVFIAVVGTDPRDILLLNFGQFWLTSTCSRWTALTVTYRAPAAGIYLVFSTTASLDQFEECCDRVLPANILTSAAPSIQDLYTLGIIPAPRIVGDFLLGSSGFAMVLSDSDVGSGSDTNSDVGSGSDTNSDVGSESDSDASWEVSTPTSLVNLDSSLFNLSSDEIDELASVLLENDELASNPLDDDDISEGSATNFDYQWFEL